LEFKLKFQEEGILGLGYSWLPLVLVLDFLRLPKMDWKVGLVILPSFGLLGWANLGYPLVT